MLTACLFFVGSEPPVPFAPNRAEAICCPRVHVRLYPGYGLTQLLSNASSDTR